MLSFYILFLIPLFLIHPHKLFSMQLGPGTASLACAKLIVPFAPFTEFIRPCSSGITIVTNNVPNPSDLSIIEKYFKSVKGINSNNIPSPRLLQSKSYLKIMGLPYLRADGNKITSENVIDFMKHIDLFENVPLATKPHIIKALPKSDIAIIWFDIWDTQNNFKAKLLINYSFNLGRHIATVRATNMNPGIPQCHNCWK